MDQHRVSKEYWDSRPYSRALGQIQQTLQPRENGASMDRPSERENVLGVHRNEVVTVGIDAVLRSLFKKANEQELNSLCSILCDSNNIAVDGSLIIQLLNEEISSRHR